MVTRSVFQKERPDVSFCRMLKKNELNTGVKEKTWLMVNVLVLGQGHL